MPVEVDGGDGVWSCEGARQGYGVVQGVRVIVTSVFAQETVVKHSGELHASGGTVTDVADESDSDRARGH